jgi:hypothetical protein
MCLDCKEELTPEDDGLMDGKGKISEVWVCKKCDSRVELRIRLEYQYVSET